MSKPVKLNSRVTYETAYILWLGYTHDLTYALKDFDITVYTRIYNDVFLLRKGFKTKTFRFFLLLFKDLIKII